ncbi:hypothetical protein [Dyadobacter luticola]|uniref:Uncharacterized protein n=1 Tax=Dyadobacter luticola TaxID=1979387 RepID=A0A5R9L4H8_9BACT|nr:hypothetical protein [Dyadobacter luticola]TLV03185.1 hypothetical protein FEN17_06110 [Dyadobacter luticola]
METEHKKGRVGNIIMILLLVAAVVGLGMHFMKPKKIDTAANENMTLFINNKISDIDQKLAKDDKIPDIATELSWHKSNTALYNEVKANKDKAIKEKRKVLEDKMVKIQKKEFPELRDAYVSSKKEILGQEKIEVSLSGDNKEILTFSGDRFAPEKAQKSFTKSIEEIVSDLRFKKIVYKSSDKQKDFADYKIDSKTDTEI